MRADYRQYWWYDLVNKNIGEVFDRVILMLSSIVPRSSLTSPRALRILSVTPGFNAPKSWMAKFSKISSDTPCIFFNLESSAPLFLRIFKSKRDVHDFFLFEAVPQR